MSSTTGYVERPYGALMLDELEEYEELIDALTTYIESGQSAGVAVHNRALAYWEIGDPERALIDFDQAAGLLPDSHMPFQLKGMLLQKLDRPADALAAFDSAVLIAPNQATVRRARALLLVEMGKLEESLGDFNHAIALEPAFARTREDRDSVLARLGKPLQQRSPKWWQFWRT